MDYRVRYTHFPRQYQAIKEEIDRAVTRVLGEGSFILRGDVGEFESRIAEMLGVRHVIGLNSGTDALILSFKALGLRPGDEVITVAHTFVATLAAIVHCGATPILADVGADFNIDADKIEQLITSRTKVLCPVHMNGRTAEMDTIMALAKKYGLAVVEDAAQALAARFEGQAAGSFGDAGCFSLHPMKNLGVAGDGGFIATNSDELNQRVRMYRNHGQITKDFMSCYGYNSRLDNLQAAIANVKLAFFPNWIVRRRELAQRYEDGLKHIRQLHLPIGPSRDPRRHDVYSSYVIATAERDALKTHLESAGVEVFVHWPVPLHRQEKLRLGNVSLPMTERISAETLSLPLFPEMTEEEQNYVVQTISQFFGA